MALPEVGREGQQRLRDGSVLLVGVGGLGSPAALYLAAAGVGRIGLVDFDTVDESNLQRQILYGSADVGRPKTEAAARRLADTNPFVDVVRHELRLDATNALEIVRGYDVVLDGSDNFATRYLVNDACVLAGRPDVYGSIFRFEGQASVFAAAGGPCYRCLHPEPPPSGSVADCATGGVLGVLPGLVGTLQANEALKLILGRGEPLIGRLLLIDALDLRFRELGIARDPDCRRCGDRPTLGQLVAEDEACATRMDERVEPAELARRLAREHPPDLLDVRDPEEWRICRIEGARLIPLAELERRLAELDPSAEIVVYCHHGPRGDRAVATLRRHGFDRAANLAGGIDAWAARVDPSLARY